MKKTLEEREAQIEKRLGKKNTTKRSSEFIQNYTQYIIQLFVAGPQTGGNTALEKVQRRSIKQRKQQRRQF